MSKLRGVKKSRFIAGGFFGEGWQGEWEGVPVAIKVARGASPTAAEALLREVEVAVNLKVHPNLVIVYGVCDGADGELQLVLEYCDDGALLDWLRRLEGKVCDTVCGPGAAACGWWRLQAVGNGTPRSILTQLGDACFVAVLCADHAGAGAGYSNPGGRPPDTEPVWSGPPGVGVGQLDGPSGVCADDDVIVVTELDAHRISVFKRGDGALLRRFGSEGDGDGWLTRRNTPLGLCFMSGRRHVAVADGNNHRMCVFSVEGEFVRHVGVGELGGPLGARPLTSSSSLTGVTTASSCSVRVARC
jgi:hypothetical protein